MPVEFILCTGRHTNVIPVNLHPITQKFMPGQIGSESIEITLPVKGHTISVNLQFTPNLTRNLCPVKFDQSNWE